MNPYAWPTGEPTWIGSVDQEPPENLFELLDNRPGWFAVYADVFLVELDPQLRAAIEADTHDIATVLFNDGVLDVLAHVDGDHMVAMSQPWPMYFFEAWNDELVSHYDSPRGGSTKTQEPS